MEKGALEKLASKRRDFRMQVRGEKEGMDKKQLKYQEQCRKFVRAHLFKY